MNRMNIPQELADILGWRRIESAKEKQMTNNTEAFVDYYLSTMHPVYNHMIQFGIDYHNFMDNNNSVGLLEFIEKYKNDSYWRLARFAKGLQKDIEAVKNTLLYPNISNGVTEGINSVIKCIKRVCGGRAKIDLLTAKMVLRHLSKLICTIEKAS